MKTIEIIGYKRANLGKKEARQLRDEAQVPCVLYGGNKQVHFHSPMILFKDLVYTPDAIVVDLNLEGNHFKCILQDIQFHPVNETILHADFLELQDTKEVKMDIPVSFTGTAPGVVKGGKLVTQQRTLKVKALPKNMPETITVDISKLDLGKSVKVREVKAENYTILNPPMLSIARVEIPRALRGKKE
jgi:large subunit ribosomal protein L25